VEDVPMDDGIYSIKLASPLGRKVLGVGTVKNGVLHAPYHVTQGALVQYREAWICPTEIHMDHDLVVYGGQNQMRRLPPGSEVSLVILEKGIKYLVCTETGDVRLAKGLEAWHRATVGIDFPVGTSGSPAFNQEGDLVGMYGTGFYDNERDYVSVLSHGPDTGVETANAEALAVASVKGGGTGSTWINTHPGSGKTRRMIPRLVREALASKKKCVVLVPNRTVSKELEEVLGVNPDVNFQVRDTGAAPGSRRVTVMCHATLVSRIVRRGLNENNYMCYIMDEAHCESAEAAYLRALIHKRSQLGSVSGILLTATLPGEEETCASIL
jgi:hypothetical protein